MRQQASSVSPLNPLSLFCGSPCISHEALSTAVNRANNFLFGQRAMATAPKQCPKRGRKCPKVKSIWVLLFGNICLDQMTEGSSSIQIFFDHVGMTTNVTSLQFFNLKIPYATQWQVLCRVHRASKNRFLRTGVKSSSQNEMDSQVYKVHSWAG